MNFFSEARDGWCFDSLKNILVTLKNILLHDKGWKFAPFLSLSSVDFPHAQSHPSLEKHVKGYFELWQQKGIVEFARRDSGLHTSKLALALPSIGALWLSDVVLCPVTGTRLVKAPTLLASGKRYFALDDGGYFDINHRPNRVANTRKMLKQKTKQYHNRIVLSLGELHGLNHFHFLVEVLPSVLRSNLIAKRVSNHLPILCVPKQYPRWLKFFLNPLGEIFHLEFGKDAAFISDSIMSPYGNRNSRKEDLELVRDFIFSFYQKELSAKTSFPKRFFFSREKTITRGKRDKIRFSQEDRLFEDYLQDLNYDKMFAEDLDYLEQYQLAYKAERFAGLHGNNMHHMVFMQNGTDVLEFVSACFAPCYMAIASNLGLTYRTMDGESLRKALST